MATVRTERDSTYAASDKGKARLGRYRQRNREQYLAYLRRYHRAKRIEKLRTQLKAAMTRMITAKNADVARWRLDVDSLKAKIKLVRLAEKKDKLGG